MHWMAHRKRRLVLTGVCIGMVLALSNLTSVAYAHFLGYDSVDGCTIADEDWTKWDAERNAARNLWGARKNLSVTGASKVDNCVNIIADTWWTVADVQWRDVNRSDLSWVGLYQNKSGADIITMNDHYVSQYNACMRTDVALHELGHALGLSHSTLGQVMYAQVQDVCSLQSHDIADYHTLWG